ncbi:MAG: aldose 1-epimerase, partial [Alicyclobacillus sp.]|nr:aldose 1-epimerase [Alicyclobacillus sp.]
PEPLSKFREPFAPYRYGLPILFPPNRVRNGRFVFGDHEYQLPLNEPPHHLHGEISQRPWTVVRAVSHEDTGASVVSEFRFDQHPDMMAYFPHPLVFRLRYTLFDGKLHLDGEVHNLGGFAPAPFALGLHPYFVLPGSEVWVTVPAAEEWPITSQSFVTGTAVSTPWVNEVNRGIRTSEFHPLDCRMVSVVSSSDGYSCTLSCPEESWQLTFSVDSQFRFLLLFRPDWSDSVSLEPYTCLTDAFNLPYPAEMTGVRGLHPGEVVTFHCAFWVNNSHTSD